MSSIAYKSALFATVFVVFHGIEEMAVAAIASKSIGGGTWFGAALVWAIMAISLLPFFSLREIGRHMGEGRLWALMFHRDPAASPAAG